MNTTTGTHPLLCCGAAVWYSVRATSSSADADASNNSKKAGNEKKNCEKSFETKNTQKLPFRPPFAAACGAVNNLQNASGFVPCVRLASNLATVKITHVYLCCWSRSRASK